MPNPVPSDPLKPGDSFQNRLFARSCVEEKKGNGPDVKLILAADYSRYAAKMWTAVDADWEAIRGSQFLLVSGFVEKGSAYEGEISIKSLEAVDDAKAPNDLEPYLMPLHPDNAEHVARFDALADSVRNAFLAQLLQKVFDKTQAIWPDYCRACAAAKKHHAYRGGLLHHSVEVAELCAAACATLPKLNHDLLITCALLHDIGKLTEMDHELDAGKYTDLGVLSGHIMQGVQIVRFYTMPKMIPGFPVALRETVTHMIAAHHGTREYGSPQPPAFSEAYVLAACDMLSARVFQYGEAIAQKKTWLPGDDKIQLYLGPLGLETETEHSQKQQPVQVFKTQPIDPEPAFTFTTTKSLPVLGLVAAGSPEQSSDEEQETREVVPPPGGADYLLRVTGDSMVGAGINADDLLYVRHQTEAANGDIVVANIAAQGQVVKRLRRTPGDPGIWLDSENPLVDYKPIPFVEGDAIQGKVTGLLREYR